MDSLLEILHGKDKKAVYPSRQLSQTEMTKIIHKVQYLQGRSLKLKYLQNEGLLSPPRRN